MALFFLQIDLHRIKNELEEKLASECLAGDEAEKVFRLNAEKESLVQFNKKLKLQGKKAGQIKPT